MRSPGEVTRIVFETPSSAMAKVEATVTPQEGQVVSTRLAEYEHVVQALDQLRATLRLASDARQFRIC